MKLFYKRNVAVGIIALALGVFAVLATAKTFGQSQTTVTGNITAFVLNPEGKPDGAVLDTGDQVRFGAETGALVAGQIKIGDQITVAGHAGSKSDYGRELRAETVQFNGQTINVIHAKPKPPRGENKGDKPKSPKGERRAPRPEDEKMPPTENGEASVSPPAAIDANAPNNADAPVAPPVIPAPRETLTANGTVKTVLVGGKGEARGLILSDGTQIALPKEVADKNLTFNEQTSVAVEGEAAKSEFGIFVRPVRLSIGDQTFSFNR